MKVLADERANNEAMQAEMDAVTQRIQQRNAERAAEAARQAAAAAAAAEAARQAAASAAQQSYSSAASEPACRSSVVGVPVGHAGEWRPTPRTSAIEPTRCSATANCMTDSTSVPRAIPRSHAAADGTVIQTVPTASSGGWGNLGRARQRLGRWCAGEHGIQPHVQLHRQHGAVGEPWAGDRLHRDHRPVDRLPSALPHLDQRAGERPAQLSVDTPAEGPPSGPPDLLVPPSGPSEWT